ncbi:MAG: 3-phosphoshikimate 1-carboxyvinyltransferase [Planctomycetes bacterium]|nr:3-phosphoshikimate 1-carboxyvinyltransferase [Planctomycetota bacterium]
MSSSLPITPLRGPFQITLDDLPGSKSLTNRALLLAALADGPSTLTNVLFADDTRVMMAALGKLGFELTINEPKRTVRVVGKAGTIPAKDADLILGNAGTAMRFLTAACCLGHGTYTLDGIPRMRQRPIGQLVDPLRSLGAEVRYLGEDGFPPLEIAARGLAGGLLTLAPTLSSQYISALLHVGPYMRQDLIIDFDGPVTSWPYIEMTLALMRQFGADVVIVPPEKVAAYPAIQVRRGQYTARDWWVEPDASNASYFLAAAAITAGATMRIIGLGHTALQGDTHFAQTCLANMGASVHVEANAITVTGPDQLRGIDVDLNAMPDMAQTLGVAALFADGPTVIRNVGNLRVKETDRMAALRDELTKLGATVRVESDDLHIDPPAGGKLSPALIETYDDHRMAMAFSLAGLRSDGVRIADPACVNKTFPRYFDYLARLDPQAGGITR